MVTMNLVVHLMRWGKIGTSGGQRPIYTGLSYKRRMKGNNW